MPDEVAVIGVDNDQFLCQLSMPPLTSVSVDAERIGYEAAAQLDRMMDGNVELRVPVWKGASGVIARHSTSSIDAIARQCGSNEAWYFISVFRKHHGITPGMYRVCGAKRGG